MGNNAENDFRTLELDLLQTNNEPIHARVPSGVIWLPDDLDMPRIVTASGVRELRTGHGLLEVSRDSSAVASTFTTAFVSCVYNLGASIIDDDYYTLTDANSLVTIKQEGIYRITYTMNIDVSGETQARSGSTTRVLVAGSIVPPAGTSHGYHRLAGLGKDSSTQSFLYAAKAGDNFLFQSIRYSGGDVLKFIEGCQVNFERICPLRHPFQGNGS